MWSSWRSVSETVKVEEEVVVGVVATCIVMMYYRKSSCSKSIRP